MRWKIGRRSENVEDRRDEAFSAPSGFGGGGFRLGGKTMLVVVVVSPEFQ